MISAIIRVAIAYFAATAAASSVAVGTLLINTYSVSKNIFSYNEYFDSVIRSFLGGWYFVSLFSLIPFLILLAGFSFINSRSRTSVALAGVAVAECLLQGSLSFEPGGEFQSRFALIQNVTAICAGISAGITFWTIAGKTKPEAALSVCDDMPQ